MTVTGSQRPGRADRRRHARRVTIVAALAAVLLAAATATTMAMLHAPLPLRSAPATTIAFVPYWDQERAFDEVQRYADNLDVISPWWYAPTADGQVVEQHERFTDVDLRRVRQLQDHGQQVMPSIANHRGGRWDFEVVGELLADEDATSAHVDALTDLVIEHGYDGIQLDYENLDAEDADAYADLVRRVAASFEEHGKTLAVAVHGKVGPETDGWGAGHDYAQLGRHAHEVHLMAYDYHHESSEPGAPAPLWWVDEVLDHATEQMPARKIVLGVGLYGYDWGDGSRAEGVTLEEAETRVRRFDGELEFDATSQTSVFTYTDGNDQRELWFETPRSVERKLELVEDRQLRGAFFWRMGGTTPEVWEVVGERFPRAAP